MFQVTQKVVCVDISPAGDGWLPVLSKGSVYTVSGICHADHRSGGTGVFLCETSPPKRPRYKCGCFKPERFVPLIERKTETGMSILRKLQNPANHKHLEKA